MDTRLCFASDNASGVHREILAAITEANQGPALAYGNDQYSGLVINKMRRAFDADAEILFTFGGTGANVIALGSITRSHEAIFCSDCSHIWSDECAAPQKFIGGKIVPVRSVHGKISVQAITDSLGPDRGVHHARPRVVSITQPTELGTLYTLEEMRTLGEFCRDREMLLHVDGARFANAAAAMNISLAALSHQAGVDVLSFGGTKNGALGAEAVIFFNYAAAPAREFIRKQVTQLPSKMRFIAAQFDALFHEQLWLRNARHANEMAKLLATQCENIGVNFLVPPEINALFPRLSVPVIKRLQKDCDFYIWNETQDEIQAVARWMTAFNTTSEEVERFAGLIKTALGAG